MSSRYAGLAAPACQLGPLAGGDLAPHSVPSRRAVLVGHSGTLLSWQCGGTRKGALLAIDCCPAVLYTTARLIPIILSCTPSKAV
jgi:hypothetical protein